jgi:hypothetical protein
MTARKASRRRDDDMPVYLDADLQAYLAEIAVKKGIELSELANDLLKTEIAIIEAVK